MTDWVIRKCATDVDGFSAGQTTEEFLRPLPASTQGDATPSSSPRDCKTRSPIIKRFSERNPDLWRN